MSDEKDYKVFLENVANLANTPQGRAFIWHLLSVCNLYDDCNSGDTNTYYMLGRRSIGLEILDILNDADPTAYPNMLLNAAKQQLEEEDNGGSRTSND